MDDHLAVREGLVWRLNREPDFIVCGEATSSEEALEKMPALQPAVAVIDITLPGRDGLYLIEQIKLHHPTCRMLAFSGRDEVVYAERTLAAGALGYVMKGETSAQLVHAIRQVATNEIALSKTMSNRILQRATTQKPNANLSVTGGLTNRELEVFRLMGKRKSRSAITKQLDISPKTLGVHLAHIRKKLNLTTACELCQLTSEIVEAEDAGHSHK